MPTYDDIDWEGLDFDRTKFASITDISKEGALSEAAELKDYFAKFGDHLPAAIADELTKFEDRVKAAPDVWSLPK